MTPRMRILMLIPVLLGGLVAGCTKENPPPGLYDPNYNKGVRPVVTSITPDSGALGGLTILTITGQNFSPTASNNLVFFDNVGVIPTTATATQLTMTAPMLANDSIVVKAAVIGSDYYSTPVYYGILAAALDNYTNFTGGQYPAGVECNSAGHLFVSVMDVNVGVGVWEYSDSGKIQTYSPAFSTGVSSWKGMKFGPGGVLFAVAGRNIVFQIPAGGGNATVWATVTGSSNTMSDLDFDANGNLWATGGGGKIYRFRPDKSVKIFPFTGTGRSVRVYAGAVFVGGKRDSLEKVWRFPIIGNDSLDAEQEFFDLSSVYGANSYGVYAVTFDTDGDMFIGTDSPDGVLIVHPDKSSAPFYPGIVKGPTVALTFGKADDLFQSRLSTVGPPAVAAIPANAVKIRTQKTGAPYYGRTM